MEEWIAGECKECGGFCCRAIIISGGYSSELLSTALPFYWSEITSQEALWINPYLIRLTHQYKLNEFHFYTCNMLTDDNLCLIHDKKPLVCANYPFYGKSTFQGPYYVPWCAYRRLEL